MKRMRIGSRLVVALAACLVAPAQASVSASRIPDGVYRANVSAASLIAAGVNAQSARSNSGIQTLIFRGHRWTNTTVQGGHRQPACSGNLSYSAQRVRLTADPGPQCGTAAGKLLFSARWSLSRAVLRFTEVKAQPNDPVPPALFGGRPWRKIG